MMRLRPLKQILAAVICELAESQSSALDSSAISQYAATTQILWQAMRVQLQLLSRSWGARLGDLFMPAAVVLAPIILGRAVGGEGAGFRFAQYTDTANFAGFLLIGGGSFMLVTRALWGFGYWLRNEMQGGTLEILSLAPASMPAILAGVGLAYMLYAALVYAGAMALGAAIFQISFQRNYLGLAALFLLLGLPSVYGLALLYGALVLRLKEADAFIQIAQWLAALLMGVYFPLAVLPPVIRLAGFLFPPAWLTHGVRSSLLDISYFSGYWFVDLGVLFLFSLFGPLLGYLAFARVEKSLRATVGLGKY